LDNLEGIPAVVATVDAGGIQAVVDLGLPIGTAKEPRGVMVVDMFVTLAQVQSGDKAQVQPMGFLHGLAHEIIAHPRDRRLESQLGWVKRDNTSDAKEDGIGAKVGDLLNDLSRITLDINLTQIGLYKPEGTRLPPVRH
jgi:hypothetical protein